MKSFFFLFFIFINVKVLLPRGFGTQSLGVYQRCLFSTTSDAKVNPANEESKTAGEAKSGKEEKSGESHQSSNTGKSVRGGVNIYSICVVI